MAPLPPAPRVPWYIKIRPAYRDWVRAYAKANVVHPALVLEDAIATYRAVVEAGIERDDEALREHRAQFPNRFT